MMMCRRLCASLKTSQMGQFCFNLASGSRLGTGTCIYFLIPNIYTFKWGIPVKYNKTGTYYKKGSNDYKKNVSLIVENVKHHEENCNSLTIYWWKIMYVEMVIPTRLTM